MREVDLTEADRAATEGMEGQFLDQGQYTRVIESTTTVRKPDGSLLLIYIEDALSRRACAAAFNAYRYTNPATNNRGYGLLPSDVVGFLDRSARLDYCRKTGFTRRHPSRFRTLRPLIIEMDGKFRELLPERWGAQRAFVETLRPEYVLPGTAFTSVTVNKTCRFRAHTDEGDFKPGFGVLTAMGHFEGGELIFPRFRTAVAIRTGGLLLADVHELHASGPLYGERLSFVPYARRGMASCLAPAEERERHANPILESPDGR